MRGGGTAWALLGALCIAALPAGAETPRLVVLIAIDQLRPERMDAGLPGGLGRIARDGRSYPESVLAHAGSSTCPGHTSLVTGRHPGPSGVPGNHHFGRGATGPVYCVADPAPDAAVLGDPSVGAGRSPRKLRVDTLGDWMKAANRETRVFGVAGKDRAAITMGGKHADAAYWLLAKPPGPFTTSSYYRKELPGWVTAFNGSDPLHDGFRAQLPLQWEAKWKLEGPRPDDYQGEVDRFERAFPHPLRSDDPEQMLQAYAISPWADTHTLEFATQLIRNEGLGSDDAPDLLAIGLSATDRIGHLYGPESHESHDALRRLDEDLARFLDFLDAQVGRDRTLVVVSADHGVLTLPEWLEETGRATCPIGGGRENFLWFIARLYTALWWEFTPLYDWPQAWVHFADANLKVNRALAEEHGVDVQRVIDFTETWLEAQPSIAQVWTRGEIRDGTSELARLYRNSFDAERSGDLVIQLGEGCLISPYSEGTSHGSPYLYDRAVPIVFYGAGVEPGAVPGRARTVDIAPTIAERLGIPRPADLAGVVLD